MFVYCDVFDYLKMVVDFDWIFFVLVVLIVLGECIGMFCMGVGKLIVDV